MDKVIIYTDGSCHGNPGPGGYAAIISYPNKVKSMTVTGSDWYTTNNRMELMAVIEGLKALTSPSDVTIITDSKYVANQINRNNYPVLICDAKKKNRDLWKEIQSLSHRHTVSAKWVRGHSGDALNEACDALANAEVIQLEREKEIRLHTFSALLLNPAETAESIASRCPVVCSANTVKKYMRQFFQKQGGL